MRNAIKWAVSLAALTLALFALAACQGTTTDSNARPCPSPAPLANGQYSSYRTQGVMVSGTTVRLSDGDLYTCTDGSVSVH